MSIQLTTLCLSIQDLLPSAKHVLTILCFRANQYHEVYSSIAKLCLDCSCSINTLDKNMKLLRDKGYLEYTGKYTGSSKKIPIYFINLNNPKNGDGKIFITPNYELDHPKIDAKITPKLGIQKDNRYKDNKKDIDSSFSKEQIKRWEKERELQMNKLL